MEKNGKYDDVNKTHIKRYFLKIYKMTDERPITIYRLSAGEKHYYGSTVLPLIQRVQIHTRDSNCSCYKAGISCSKDLKWEVVETTTQELRYERENYYIRNFPCVNIAGRYDVPAEKRARQKLARDKWLSIPENREKSNQARFKAREERKKQELETKEGIKIKAGVILDRPMHENLPKEQELQEEAYIEGGAAATDPYEVPKYLPFGIDKPEMNELYEKHKDYIEGKLSSLAWKSKEQTYFCTDCNKRLASSAPVVLRRHFGTYKHLINSFQMETHEKPLKERKPYVRKPRPGSKTPSDALQQSFQESIEEGYVFK